MSDTINVDKQQFEMRDVLYAVNRRVGGPLKAVTINNWITRGHLPLSEQAEEIGQGKSRSYTARDIVYIAALNAVSGLGLEMAKAKVLLQYFDTRLDTMFLNSHDDRGGLHIFLYRNLEGELQRTVVWGNDENGSPAQQDGLDYVTVSTYIDVDKIIGQVIALLLSVIEDRDLDQKTVWSLEGEVTEIRQDLRDFKLRYAEKSLRRTELEENLLARYESLEAAYPNTDDDDVREWELIVGEQNHARRAIELKQKKLDRLLSGDDSEGYDD